MRKLVFTFLSVLFSVGLMAQAPPQQQWDAEYNNPNGGGNYDNANGIVVDANGNSYVTGESYNQNQSYNIVTIKYDPAGNVVWSQEFDNGYNSDDNGYKIAIDAMGNVYVLGRVYNPSQYYNYITIKYDANGNMIWSREANGSSNYFDEPRAIFVDPANNNIYVTGYMYNYSYVPTYGTFAYDNSGNLLWSNEFANPYYYYNGCDAKDIVSDGNGNVYVTGQMDPYYYYNGYYRSGDYGTVKFDNSGNVQWYNLFDFMSDYFGYPWSSNYDEAGAITINSGGNVVVTGNCYNGYYGWGQDINTVAYDANGSTQWVNSYNGQAYSDDYGRAITADGVGNVFVGGNTYGNSGYYNFAAIKIDGGGTTQWASEYNYPSNNTDEGQSIALDGNGNVYVGGSTYNNNQQWNYGVASFDGNGTSLWGVEYNGSGNGYDYSGKKEMAVDAGGNVYITGQAYGQTGGDNYATVRYCTPPAAAGIITGTSPVCQGQNAVTFSGLHQFPMLRGTTGCCPQGPTSWQEQTPTRLQLILV